MSRRLFLAFLSVLSTILIGTVGYWLIGAGHWALVDCLYQTVIGITTAGFGEIIPLGETTLGRPFTIVLLCGGMVAVGWFVTTAAAFLIEGELSGLTWRKRMDTRVKKLSGHYIVCGAGTTGIHCVRELCATGAPFVVVDRSEEVARALTRDHGCLAVVGDATHDEVLLEAGIQRARGSSPPSPRTRTTSSSPSPPAPSTPACASSRRPSTRGPTPSSAGPGRTRSSPRT